VDDKPQTRLASLAERDGAGRVLTVLAAAGAALEAARVPYVLVGGLASAALGRPRFTEDIDVLVTASGARDALAALAGAGFDTEETNPHWIYKAEQDGIVVDLIFALKGGIHLDDQMLARSVTQEVAGSAIRVAPPEDLVVSKAIADDEPSRHHWFDALGVIAACELDWEYLLARAQRGARRVLGLLVYAQSDDLVVPAWVVERLVQTIYEPDPALDG
jgi:hypothetical protein